MKKYRVAVAIESPIQYHAPLFSYLASLKDVELTVLYFSDRGVKPFYHSQLKVVLSWSDLPVLEGYQYKILKNYSPFWKGNGFWTFINPGIIVSIFRGRYDLVILNGYNYFSLWLAWTTALALKIPIYLRGESEDFFPRPMIKRWLRNFVTKMLLKACKGAFYIGRMNKQFYLNRGVREKDLHFFPYAVDNNRFDPTSAEKIAFRKKLRAQLSVSEATVIFVMASKHRADRNPMDVVDAFCRLDHEMDTHLLIMGDGPLRGQLESRIKDTGYGKKVTFTGLVSQTEYPFLLAACDVLVHASTEPWGGVVTEAISAGLALLISDQICGAPDMLMEGKNGYAFQYRNIDEIVERMRHILHYPDKIIQMRQFSRKIAVETMSFDTCGKGLLNALDNTSYIDR